MNFQIKLQGVIETVINNNYTEPQIEQGKCDDCEHLIKKLKSLTKEKIQK
jgi:hypothetical protein